MSEPTKQAAGEITRQPTELEKAVLLLQGLDKDAVTRLEKATTEYLSKLQDIKDLYPSMEGGGFHKSHVQNLVEKMHGNTKSMHDNETMHLKNFLFPSKE